MRALLLGCTDHKLILIVDLSYKALASGKVELLIDMNGVVEVKLKLNR